jgi:hypothetical protein
VGVFDGMHVLHVLRREDIDIDGVDFVLSDRLWSIGLVLSAHHTCFHHLGSWCSFASTIWCAVGCFFQEVATLRPAETYKAILATANQRAQVENRNMLLVQR